MTPLPIHGHGAYYDDEWRSRNAARRADGTGASRGRGRGGQSAQWGVASLARGRIIRDFGVVAVDSQSVSLTSHVAVGTLAGGGRGTTVRSNTSKCEVLDAP
jgi:hypothetical protein